MNITEIIEVEYKGCRVAIHKNINHFMACRYEYNKQLKYAKESKNRVERNKRLLLLERKYLSYFYNKQIKRRSINNAFYHFI